MREFRIGDLVFVKGYKNRIFRIYDFLKLVVPKGKDEDMRIEGDEAVVTDILTNVQRYVPMEDLVELDDANLRVAKILYD